MGESPQTLTVLIVTVSEIMEEKLHVNSYPSD